jgi:hypothetical protein
MCAPQQETLSCSLLIKVSRLVPHEYLLNKWLIKQMVWGVGLEALMGTEKNLYLYNYWDLTYLGQLLVASHNWNNFWLPLILPMSQVQTIGWFRSYFSTSLKEFTRGGILVSQNCMGTAESLNLVLEIPGRGQCAGVKLQTKSWELFLWLQKWNYELGP